jgi:hypothetical protein
MNERRLNLIYDLLVSIGGANERYRQEFILIHMEEPPCREYRFSGHLGFGGKYRSQTNTVDCYLGDENFERRNVISTLNKALEALDQPTVTDII